MARGNSKKKGARGGKPPSKKAGERRPSGIEKYGQNEADAFLKLDDDDDACEEESEAFEEEDDVMALGDDADAQPDDDDDIAYAPPTGKKSAKSHEGEKVSEETGTKGWARNEFYGGDDAGDDSDVDSEEDLIYEEAKRLEQLRAKHLSGQEDVLASLLGPASAATSSEAKETGVPDTSAESSLAVDAKAQFESIFAAEAEQVSVPRDLSKLPAAEKKGLMKKEAPELLPLLSDFKAKLEDLRELMPLLHPQVTRRLPASGATYLEAKAALLLNTLANLSFYVLLRAEGGDVRAHPVVPQLVWLRELHERLSPLDKKLGKKVRKSIKIAREVSSQAETPAREDAERPVAKQERSHRDVEAPAPKKKSLRQRLEQLVSDAGRNSNGSSKKDASAPLATPLTQRIAAKDLLRLPKLKQSAAGGVGSTPLDLEEVDPSLGMWAPSTTVGEQLTSVQQQLREQAVRAKAARASADENTEARPVRRRERGATLPMDDVQSAAISSSAPPPADEDDDGDEFDVIKDALKSARLKKSKRAKAEEARADAKEEARRLRQFKPEEVQEGRRKTSKKILENRGLQRIRKKHSGNARVHNKEKYEKMVKRRKGAVVEVREGAADGATYDGEATGMRTHVKKSLKLG